MNFVKQYREYCEQNPQKYWFKRKVYGWGWMPVQWQAWLVVLIYLLAIFFCVLTLQENTSVLPILLLTSALIYVCYKTGEKPRWQWGFPEKRRERADEKQKPS